MRGNSVEQMSRIASIYPGIEETTQEASDLQIFVEVASLRVRYEENVQIDMLDINDVDGRVDWLQQVAELLKIFPAEGEPLTEAMFFSAIKELQSML